MASEKFNELVFQLGDLAREHLTEEPKLAAALQAVYEMEDALVARREELEATEAEINQTDTDHQTFMAQVAAETEAKKKIIVKWRTAVLGVEGRSRDLKKRMSTQKATLRYQQMSQKSAEAKHKELELREGHDVKKIMLSAENLKKMRLTNMRMNNEIDEMSYEFEQILTPRPGQQGAAGILAHKRLLEIEDEIEDKKVSFEAHMKELEAELSAREEEVALAEEDLDGVVFCLGEAAWKARVKHPALDPLYVKIDKAK